MLLSLKPLPHPCSLSVPLALGSATGPNFFLDKQP